MYKISYLESIGKDFLVDCLAELLPVLLQESSEDVSGGLPFLVDLALGLSVLACSMLRILYNGPEITKDEETCQELLRSKLLQR